MFLTLQYACLSLIAAGTPARGPVCMPSLMRFWTLRCLLSCTAPVNGNIRMDSVSLRVHPVPGIPGPLPQPTLFFLLSFFRSQGPSRLIPMNFSSYSMVFGTLKARLLASGALASSPVHVISVCHHILSEHIGSGSYMGIQGLHSVVSSLFNWSI